MAAQTSTEALNFADLHGDLVANVARAIQGKHEAIDLVVLALLSGGHILIEDVPGVGKTTLAKAVARSIDMPFGRIQFTPDLLPTDVIGVNIWNRSADRFEFRAGPVFANIVLADEINRASPKTQSALLEAMSEGQVTVDGTTHLLSRPFMVLATQNPIEHEGTYPLPESQLDRFLLRISMGYPAREAELDILRTHGDIPDEIKIEPVLDGHQINAMVQAIQTVTVAPEIQGYLVDLAEATRAHPATDAGMSPRATLALQRVARTRAATRGRTYVIPDDVKTMVGPVVAHRLILTPQAQVGEISAERVLNEILDRVPVPTPDPARSR